MIFSKKDLYTLYNNYKTWEYVGRRMAELAYVDMDLFYYNFLTKTPTQRYQYLQATMKNILDKIPQYHVASYLGITPISLSRIRNSYFHI